MHTGGESLSEAQVPMCKNTVQINISCKGIQIARSSNYFHYNLCLRVFSASLRLIACGHFLRSVCRFRRASIFHASTKLFTNMATVEELKTGAVILWLSCAVILWLRVTTLKLLQLFESIWIEVGSSGSLKRKCVQTCMPH